MPSNLKKYAGSAFFLLFNLALFIALSRAEITLSPDSQGYIYGSFLRAPGYPLLLSFFKLFAPDNFLRLAVIFQAGFVISSVLWAACVIKKHFSLSKPFFLLVYLVLLWPLLPFKGGSLANQIMTEAVTYGLFLIASGFFIKGLFEKSTKALLFFIILSSFTVLLKPQFMFMPLCAAVVTGALFLADHDKRKALTLFAALFLSLFAVKIADKSWHYFRHGSFSSGPGFGLHMAMNAFFLSDDDTAAQYSSPDNALFSDIYGSVKASAVRSGDITAKGVSAYAVFYTDACDVIMWKILMPSLDKYCTAETATACLMKKEALSARIGKTFIKNNPKKFCKLLAYKLLAKTPLYFWFFMAAVFIVSGTLFIRTADPAAGAVFLAVLMNFANYAIVGVLAPLNNRFTFPTEMLQTALLLGALALAARKTACRN
ncbi:MAG: hypothetical protein WCS77_10660 [Elusimicrobiaceae bacterium]